MSSSQPLACGYHSTSSVSFGEEKLIRICFISSEILISVVQFSEGVSVFQDLLLVLKVPLSGAKEHRGTGRRQGDPVLFSCWNCAMMFWLQLCSAVLTSKRSPSAAFGACGSTQLLIQIILETGS